MVQKSFFLEAKLALMMKVVKFEEKQIGTDDESNDIGRATKIALMMKVGKEFLLKKGRLVSKTNQNSILKSMIFEGRIDRKFRIAY